MPGGIVETLLGGFAEGSVKNQLTFLGFSLSLSKNLIFGGFEDAVQSA
jgi:hypothetical protein